MGDDCRGASEAATVAADGVGSDVLVPKPTLRPAQASSDGEETGGGGHSATAEVAAAKLQADSTGAAQACHACFCLLGYAPAGSEPMQVDSDDAGVCFTSIDAPGLRPCGGMYVCMQSLRPPLLHLRMFAYGCLRWSMHARVLHACACAACMYACACARTHSDGPHARARLQPPTS
jgi:hypothetical protein